MGTNDQMHVESGQERRMNVFEYLYVQNLWNEFL